MKKKITITLLIVAISVTALFAQPPQDKDNDPMKKEIKAYVEKNIIPIMKPLRKSFDKELTNAEKQKINELREQFKTIIEEKRQQMEKQRHAGMPPLPMIPNEDMKNIMDEVKTIVDNHSQSIDNLLSQVEDDKEQWRKDIKAIVDRYIGKNKPDSLHPFMGYPHGGFNNEAMRRFRHHPDTNKLDSVLNMHNPMHGKHHPDSMGGPGHPPMPMMCPHHLGFERFFHPEGFVLWNPKDTTDGTVKNNPIELKAYPIPAAGKSYIEFTIKEAGQVKITLLNSKGIEVMLIVDEYKVPAVYTKVVDVSSLKNGMYYYKAEVNNSYSVKTIVIHH